jgi:pyrroloquinoline quinone biosynthesis protein B
MDDPALARNVASVAILSEATGKKYLVDAGPDIRPQLEMLARITGSPPARVNRSPVDGVFLTHAHLGHYTGLAFFGFEAIHTTDLPVWCTGPMAELLRENAPWSQLVRIGNIDLREIQPGEPQEPEPGVKVTAIPVPHRDEYADTVAFLIEGSRKTILYAPDTDSWDRWDPPLRSVLTSVDIAILDGTFYSPDELPGRRVEEIGHPLISTTMDLLQTMVDEERIQVWFTHMNHSNPVLGPNPHAAGDISKRGFHILEDGQEFPL